MGGGNPLCHVNYFEDVNNGYGQPGWACCSPCSPCGLMEGDCNSDDDCLPGLVCAHDVGAQFSNLPEAASLDLCMLDSSRRLLAEEHKIPEESERKTNAFRKQKL